MTTSVTCSKVTRFESPWPDGQRPGIVDIKLMTLYTHPHIYIYVYIHIHAHSLQIQKLVSMITGCGISHKYETQEQQIFLKFHNR